MRLHKTNFDFISINSFSVMAITLSPFFARTGTKPVKLPNAGKMLYDDVK